MTATAGHGASLTLAPVAGERDAPEGGVLTLDPSDGGRRPRAYRCAQTFPDLPLSTWTPLASAAPVTIHRLLPGYQSAPDQMVLCEIAYASGEPTIVSAVEDVSRRRGSSLLPRSFLRPRRGVLFDLLPASSAKYGAWPVVQYNDQGRSLMRFAYGNNFVPLEWSTGGYAWSSEHTRGVDQGEPRPFTVIALHTYARWLGADVMNWTPPQTELSIELAGANLDLKGGAAYFAILVALPDGRHARYHLRRPLVVENGRWTRTGWTLRHVRGDWWCSFASNKQTCRAVGRTPDLRYVEAVEVVITDGSLPPTGVLKMRHLQLRQ